MALYVKIMGAPTTGPYKGEPDECFLSALAEYALGNVTAQTLVDTFQLTPEEQTDAQSLYTAIRNGNTALVGGSALQRLFEVSNVLRLAVNRIAPYVDEASVKTRLGVP